MGRRLTTEEFIEKARSVHGTKYDYSHVEYKAAQRKVAIVCPVHGCFLQSPNNHLNHAGCPDCGRRASAQSRKYTTKEFVEKAKSVHGDYYDYSRVKYVNHRVRVEIICPDHGSFMQTPVQHLKKKGCPDCASKRGSTNEFIQRAISIHGNRYDYSTVEYLNSYTNVTMKCPRHGYFEQVPYIHLRGHGCPQCGSSKHSIETFVKAANEIHNGQYDYSKVSYSDNKTDVTIICPDHGPFLQRPDKHLRGYGCKVCSGVDPITTKSFREKARAIHGDLYDYSLVQASSAHRKVTIICPDHGPFLQTPNSHITKKTGCPACAPNRRLDTDSFIAKANRIHGGRYGYSQVKYVNASSFVTIDCSEHGPFEQVASSHLMGHGCPDCAESGFNPSMPGTLYYLAIKTDDGDIRYKIGITNLSVEERFRPDDLSRIRVVRTWRFLVGRHAAEREAEILRNYAGDRYYGPPILLSGNTELFTHDILGLDHAT